MSPQVRYNRTGDMETLSAKHLILWPVFRLSWLLTSSEACDTCCVMQVSPYGRRRTENETDTWPQAERGKILPRRRHQRTDRHDRRQALRVLHVAVPLRRIQGRTGLNHVESVVNMHIAMKLIWRNIRKQKCMKYLPSHCGQRMYMFKRRYITYHIPF